MCVIAVITGNIQPAHHPPPTHSTHRAATSSQNFLFLFFIPLIIPAFALHLLYCVKYILSF